MIYSSVVENAFIVGVFDRTGCSRVGQYEGVQGDLEASGNNSYLFLMRSEHMDSEGSGVGTTVHMLSHLWLRIRRAANVSESITHEDRLVLPGLKQNAEEYSTHKRWEPVRNPGGGGT
jgi:hypothetical protein